MNKLDHLQEEDEDDEYSVEIESVTESYSESVSEPPPISPYDQEKLSLTPEYFSRKSYSSFTLSRNMLKMKNHSTPIICDSNLDLEGKNEMNRAVNLTKSRYTLKNKKIPIEKRCTLNDRNSKIQGFSIGKKSTPSSNTKSTDHSFNDEYNENFVINDSEFPIPTATIVSLNQEKPTFFNCWKKMTLFLLTVVAIVAGVSTVLLMKGNQTEETKNHPQDIANDNGSSVMMNPFQISLLTYKGLGATIPDMIKVTSTHLHPFFSSLLNNYDSIEVSVRKSNNLYIIDSELLIQNNIVGFQAAIKFKNNDVKYITSTLFHSVLGTAFTGNNANTYLRKLELSGIEPLQVAVLDEYDNIIASSVGYEEVINSMQQVTKSQPPAVMHTKAPSKNMNENSSETLNSSVSPTNSMHSMPTNHPSLLLINNPSVTPTRINSKTPSINPTSLPLEHYSGSPTNIPFVTPTFTPSTHFSVLPSNNPSFIQTTHPSLSPTYIPSFLPTENPSIILTSSSPTGSLSTSPSSGQTFPPINVQPSQPTKTPYILPTPFPTLSPTNHGTTPTEHPTTGNTVDVRVLPSLVTGPIKRRAGFMFDIKAKSFDITVIGLDVDLDISWSHSKIEVWTKVGTFKKAKNDPIQWSMNNYGKAFIIPEIPTQGELVTLPVRNQDSFEPIKISKGETFGFYITMPSTGMVTSNNVSNQSVFDEFIEIQYGGAKGYPFLWTSSPQTWSGAVRYTLSNDD